MTSLTTLPTQSRAGRRTICSESLHTRSQGEEERAAARREGEAGEAARGRKIEIKRACSTAHLPGERLSQFPPQGLAIILLAGGALSITDYYSNITRTDSQQPGVCGGAGRGGEWCEGEGRGWGGRGYNTQQNGACSV